MDRDSLLNTTMNSLTQRASGWDGTTRVLRQALNGVVERAQQNIIASVDESTSGLSQQFVEQLGNQLSDVSQGWVDEATGQLSPVPDGTKFFSREGNITNIIVEQKPQQRRIRFLNDYFLISLPYIQFTVSFVKNGNSNVFQHLKVSCSKVPFTSLEQDVHYLPLPNVGYGDSWKVCTGRVDGMDTGGRGSVVEQVNTIIGSFWQSQFNTDLSGHLIDFLANNFGVNRSNISVPQMSLGFRQWQEKCAQDPTFPIQAANYSGSGKIGRLIASDMTSRSGRTAFKNRMKATITNNLNGLTQRVMGELRNINIVQDNVEALHRASINNEVRAQLREGYQVLHNAMNTELSTQRSAFDGEVARTNASLQRRERTLETNRRTFADEKRQWESEKLRIQLELHRASEYLKAKIAEAEGVPLPPRPNLPTVLAEPVATATPRIRRPRATAAHHPAVGLGRRGGDDQRQPSAAVPVTGHLVHDSSATPVAATPVAATPVAATPVAATPVAAQATPAQEVRRPWTWGDVVSQVAARRRTEQAAVAAPAQPVAPVQPAPAPAPQRVAQPATPLTPPVRRVSNLQEVGLDIILDAIAG